MSLKFLEALRQLEVDLNKDEKIVVNLGVPSVTPENITRTRRFVKNLIEKTAVSPDGCVFPRYPHLDINDVARAFEALSSIRSNMLLAALDPYLNDTAYDYMIRNRDWHTY